MLPAVESARDLGILFSTDLSPSVHVNNVVSKAHARANMILRSFVFRDINLLIRAFITYVRPLVEYNTVVWSLSALRDIDALESVQQRFTKRLSRLKHMSYAERLKYLNLPSP